MEADLLLIVLEFIVNGLSALAFVGLKSLFRLVDVFPESVVLFASDIDAQGLHACLHLSLVDAVCLVRVHPHEEVEEG